MIHKFPVRVYYEDTDMAGIVYYANYLKFIERARSTLVLEVGIDQVAMREQELVFAIKKVNADYIGSAKLNDDLTVETTLSEVTGAKIVFRQNVFRDSQMIFSALVTVVCITTPGEITRFPADIRAKLNELVK